jgi:hypothetical protein
MNDNETRFLILKYLKDIHDEDPSLGANRAMILQKYQIPDKDLGKNMQYLKNAKLIDMELHLGGNFIASIKDKGIDVLTQMEQKIQDQKLEKVDKKEECVISNLITETKEYVDSKLELIDPEILTRLNFIYEDLMAQSHDYGFARVAYDCKDVLLDFLDAVLTEDSKKNIEKLPKWDHAKIKLNYTLKKSVEDETRSLLLSERFNYIITYFDALTEFMQKGGKRDVVFTLEDAKSCLIYTYLFMRDILKLMNY